MGDMSIGLTLIIDQEIFLSQTQIKAVFKTMKYNLKVFIL